jgi:ParB-like chromosome segregation protein Spo0J
MKRLTMIAARPLEVRSLPIRKLRPASYNPRLTLQPGDPAYMKLERSLREFGLVEPLIWNEHTGHVVGGHARLRILKEMGVTEVPVSVVWLSPARERALNVILNNQEAQGRFDPARLAGLLTKLEKLPEMKLTGFDREALSTLRLEPVEVAEREPEPERVEVMLTMSPDTYDLASEELDALVAKYNLTSHVRQR